MINIYYCNASDTLIPEEISEYRKDKILLAKHTTERVRMINSAKVLKAGFSDRGISEKDVNYKLGEYGKPFASNFPKIHFNLSHSDNLSICAFCDNEIGVDCEETTRDIPSKILSRYFSKSECDAFSSTPVLLWTAKEALAKYSGKGLALSRSDCALTYFDSEITIDGYFFKRIEIEGYTVVICTPKADNVTVKKIN